MPISVFELFKIGIGPSSSHTIGPMIAAHRFLTETEAAGVFDEIAEVVTELFGSLALTGRGHGTDGANLLGLAGEVPERINVDNAPAVVDAIRRHKCLARTKGDSVCGIAASDHTRESLPRHPSVIPTIWRLLDISRILA